MGQILGIAVNGSDTSTKGHTLGERFIDQQTGKEYIFVQASSAITIGQCCTITSAFAAAPGTDVLLGTLSNFGVGVALGSIASSSYGWLQIFGKSTAIQAGKGATYKTAYYLSATAGRLEITGTVTSICTNRIVGIFLTTTCYSADSVASGFINYPKYLSTNEVANPA